MSKEYRISSDGTIFQIREDGSITKLAKIDDSGHVSDLSSTAVPEETSSNGVYWFFIILFAIAAIFFCALYIESKNDYRNAIWELSDYENVTSSLRSEVSSIRQERDNAKSELAKLRNKLSGTYPILITNIQMGNTTYDGTILTNYGNKIYSSETMYLCPKIEYTGLTSGTKSFNVKLYNPDGTISRGTSSPSGFSYSSSVYVNIGDNNTAIMGGWGGSTKGHWRSGTYSIEVWYGNTCLKTKTFTIY